MGLNTPTYPAAQQTARIGFLSFSSSLHSALSGTALSYDTSSLAADPEPYRLRKSARWLQQNGFSHVLQSPYLHVISLSFLLLFAATYRPVPLSSFLPSQPLSSLLLYPSFFSHVSACTYFVAY